MKAFQKNYMKVGVRELLRRSMVPARAEGSACSGDGPYRKIFFRRQMAAAAGKKRTTSLSLFMEAFGLEVEEELSTLATQTWLKGHRQENCNRNKKMHG